MSSASPTGPNDTTSGLDPRAPGTPGEEHLRDRDRDAAGRTPGEYIETAVGVDANAVDPRVADDQAQPIDPALIAGGEDMVGIANDMTTGPDTMGADSGADRAAEWQADEWHTVRDGGNTRDD